MEKSRVSKLLNSDKFLAIISVFIAVILWAYVSYVLDPETQKQILDIPVKFINEQALMNSSLIMDEKEYFVDIEVKGRRNVLSSLNNKSVSAEVDLSRYLKLGTNKVNVKIEGIPASIEITQDPQDIFIALSKAYVIEKEISISIVGEPKQGYIIKNPVVNPVSVTIQGDRELIESIKNVTVIADVSNLDTTLISKETLNVIDGRGNEIRDVKMNIDEVSVVVPIEMDPNLIQAKLKTVNNDAIDGNKDMKEIDG